MENKIIHRPDYSVIAPYLAKGIVIIEFEKKDGTKQCSAFTQASALLPKKSEVTKAIACIEAAYYKMAAASTQDKADIVFNCFTQLDAIRNVVAGNAMPKVAAESAYVNLYDVHNQKWAKVNPVKILTVLILE